MEKNIQSVLPQSYYSRLWIFQKAFQTGLPILTHHKIGKSARGARLPFLYVHPKLFQLQVKELFEHGFQTISLSSLKDRPHEKCIILTFDDGFQSIFKNGMPLLNHYRFQGIQFLVPEYIGKTNAWDQSSGVHCEPLMDEVQIREWLAAGHEIGAHTMSHPRLTTISVSQAREEIAASKKVLEDRFGVPVRHFCYPYGDYNETIRSLVMENGYQTACTTKAGLNSVTVDSFELRRLTARYPSRNRSDIIQRIQLRWQYYRPAWSIR